MNNWTKDTLGKLDAHFAQHSYLLGNKPTIGDFGLAGPLVAHVGRDPWPKQHLTDPLPHLTAWISRIQSLTHEDVELAIAASPVAHQAQYASDEATDAIPDTLLPILDSIFVEYPPMVSGTVAQVQTLVKSYPAGKSLPRWLGDIKIPMGSESFTRCALPFSLWKAQLLQDTVAEMSAPEKGVLRAWLRSRGGQAEELMDMEVPRVEKVALKVKLVSAPSK